MSLDNFLNKSISRWMEGDGPHSSVVISTRVRLARNFGDFAFPGQAGAQELEKVEQQVRRWWNQGGLKALGKTSSISMRELDENQRQALVDQHLVSPNLARQGYGMVLLDKDGSVSIMVNEEDHLRIQTLFSGLQLAEAWDLASRVDDLLTAASAMPGRPNWVTSPVVPPMWHRHEGFGNVAPARFGLGGTAAHCAGTISKVGMVVRGLRRGLGVPGQYLPDFQPDHLGQSEEEIIEALNRVALQVIRQELDTRQKLLERDGVALADRIWRAYGILANARVITSGEALELLSSLRLGIDLNIIKGLSPRILQELLVMTRPGYLQQVFGRKLSPRERDEKRAELIRELVNKK